MGHMGNRGTGGMGTSGIDHMGNRSRWGTGVDGAHGSCGTWA